MPRQSLAGCCQERSPAHWDVHGKPLWGKSHCGGRVWPQALGQRAKKGKTALREQATGRMGLHRIGVRRECFAVSASQMCRDNIAWGARWLKVLLSISIQATCMLGAGADVQHMCVSRHLGMSTRTVCPAIMCHCGLRSRSAQLQLKHHLGLHEQELSFKKQLLWRPLCPFATPEVVRPYPGLQASQGGRKRGSSKSSAFGPGADDIW